MLREIAVDECPLNALSGLREDEAAGTLNGGETNKYKYKCKTAPESDTASAAGMITNEPRGQKNMKKKIPSKIRFFFSL